MEAIGRMMIFVPSRPPHPVTWRKPLSALPWPGWVNRKSWSVSCMQTDRVRGNEDEDEEWVASKCSPYEVLGLVHQQEPTLDDIKEAFRARVKEYHPDVYKGRGDANSITQRIIQAYELLLKEFGQENIRKSSDPFEEPECDAEDIFVYEPLCIGRACPYSCVGRAPGVFQFNSSSGRAQAVVQGNGGEYEVQLAVGQCPRNCIYYVTPLQREILEKLWQSALEGVSYSSEISLLEGLLAQAIFENGRYRKPKRTASRSTKWVDWY